jgi:general secretion pathway protein C
MMNRYFSIGNIVLITAGVYLCVNAFYTIITAGLDYGPVAIQSTANPVAAPNEQGPGPISAYQAISDRNLFNTGTAAAGPKPAKMDIEKLKQTDMKLKLWGTVAGEGRRAYAVIEDSKAREQNLYRIGDSIQNATVKIILRQKVILRVNNQDEILVMEEPVARRGASRKIAGRTTGGSSAPKIPVSRYPRKISLRKDQIQKALENLPQLMEQATIRPHIEDGQPGGISITGIKPNAIFRQMRLRNGDIITGVNGNSIDSVEDAMKIFEDISSGSNFQIEIKRRGRAQTIDYNIQ